MTLPDITAVKRIAKVFQGLLDFIAESHDQSSEGKNIQVPDGIQSLVLKFQVAHEDFEKGITNYMHQEKRNDSQVKIVEEIVDSSPHYLSVKDEEGDLPIHSAAYDGSSFSTYIPFLAKAGIQHGVGGETGRGGLVVKGSDGDCALTNIASEGNLNVMKALQSSEPPLLQIADVNNFILIHRAAIGNNLELVKMMIDMNPAGIYKTCTAGEMPIYDAKSKEVAKLLLKSAIKYDPKHKSIGGLFAKNNKGIMAINHMINKFGKEDTWECIEDALSTNDDVPILHKTILHTPEYINDIVTSFPDACLLRDENGRLPIHIALETGMKWSTTLILIMNSNLEHLGDVDPLTKLCPGALAAVEPSSGLRTVNYLMSKYPKHAQISVSGSDEGQKKRKKQKLKH